MYVVMLVCFGNNCLKNESAQEERSKGNRLPFEFNFFKALHSENLKVIMHVL